MNVAAVDISQINMYARCPLQYYFRYVMGIRKPPKSAMTVGISFHVAAEENYKHKVVTQEDLPTEQVLDIFSDKFEDLAKETEWEEDEDPGRVKDTGVRVTKTYREVLAPQVTPIATEQKFEMRIPDAAGDIPDWKFVGVVDVREENRVRETKTTGKALKTPLDSHVLQTVAYIVAIEAITAEETAGVIDYAVKKNDPEILSFPVTADDMLYRYLQTVAYQAVKGIAAEIWIPRRDHFLCSRRWCAYWNECEKLAGGRVKE